jgi:hypothetical protein
MSRALSILVLGLVSGLAACETTDPAMPLTTERSAEAAEAPLTGTLGDPSAPHGASVFWDSTYVGFAHYDASRHLMAVHGYIVPLCEGNPLGKEPRMTVETPAQIAQRFVAVRADDEPVVVYRTDTGALTCALVTSAEARVASGSVRHRQTFTLASFEATWVGAVMAPDGSADDLTETYQLTADVHDPNNSAKWSLNASSILIH